MWRVTLAIPFLPTQQIRSCCRSVASGPSDYRQNTNSWLCYRSSCTIKETMSEFLDTVSYSFAHALQQLSYWLTMQCLRNSLALAKASSYSVGSCTNVSRPVQYNFNSTVHLKEMCAFVSFCGTLHSRAFGTSVLSFEQEPSSSYIATQVCNTATIVCSCLSG